MFGPINKNCMVDQISSEQSMTFVNSVNSAFLFLLVTDCFMLLSAFISNLIVWYSFKGRNIEK